MTWRPIRTAEYAGEAKRGRLCCPSSCPCSGPPKRCPWLGAEALLDFRLDVALDGEPLREDEIARLLATTDGLALVRGQWVEVDPDRLRRTLDGAAEGMGEGLGPKASS